MRKLNLFFLILVLAASGILLVGAQYGEESESLGQFVDEFTDSNNISVTVNVIRNTTIGAMELNASAFGPVFEDFTTYTEVDEDGDVTITEPKIEWVTMRRDAETYVWKDFGAGFFGDFEHKFQVNITDMESGDATSAAVAAFSVMSNNTGVVDDLQASNWLGVFLSQNVATDDQFRLRVWERDGGGNVFLTAIGQVFDINDPLFITFNRSDVNVGIYIYDSEARTNLLESFTGVGNGKTYRYLEPMANWGRDVDPADHQTGYLKDFSMGEAGGFESSGYFTTTDYLDQVNGSTLVLMTEADIPVTGGITVEFSNDNATWGNSRTLTDGHLSIDLRFLNETGSFYLNYSITTSDISETPRLNQSRLITTEGPIVITPGAPGQNVSGVWIEYRASAINFTVGVHAGGDLNSTFDIDGDTWNHTEVVGAPGSVISINFTGVDPDAECVWVTIWYLYDGNLQHDFDIEMWNFTSSAWVDDGHIVDGVIFSWVNSTIYALRIPNEFLSGGEVRVQLNHESPGNMNHDLFIDYVRLIARIPSDVDGAITIVTFESDFPWIAIAIILMMVAYLLFRPK